MVEYSQVFRKYTEIIRKGIAQRRHGRRFNDMIVKNECGNDRIIRFVIDQHSTLPCNVLSNTLL